MLKEEMIEKLKCDNNAKTKELLYIHSRELQVMKVENIELQRKISESKVFMHVTLASKGEDV